MLKFNTFNLTLEQQKLINSYHNRWQQIALKTTKIDREAATTAINAAYEFIEQPQPNILFYPSPYAALDYIYNEIKNSWGNFENISLGNPIAANLIEKLSLNMQDSFKGEILEQLQGNVDQGLAGLIGSEVAIKLQEAKLMTLIWSNFGEMAIASTKNSDADQITKTIFEFFFRFGFVFNTYLSLPIWQAFREFNQLFSHKQEADAQIAPMGNFLFTGNANTERKNKYRLPVIEISSRLTNVLVPEVMADFGYYIDYCHEVLNCDRDAEKWNIFYNLIINCGWVLPYKKTAVVCERPTKINLETSGAIEFSDHFRVNVNR